MNTNNKKSKYEFLKNEIIDNYFIPDIELAKTFISKYNLNDKRKNLENYIFRIKKQQSLISILNSKIKKLAYENKFPSEIKLANRYFVKFEEEYIHKYNNDDFVLSYVKFNVLVSENINSLEPIQFKFNQVNNYELREQTDKEFIFVKRINELEENIIRVPYNIAPTLDRAKKYLEEKNVFSKPIELIRDKKEVKIEQKAPIKEQPENVLIIADLHIPFEHPDYLNFCIEMQKKYNTTKTIFIGDIIDNHYQSFHPTNPDGYSAGEELRRTKDKIRDWYKNFPDATVILGNHDLVYNRRVFAQGLSREWVRGLGEVLNVPNWKFQIKLEHNNVLYIHGTGSSGMGAAYNKALYENISIVQGHLHTIANINYVDQNRFGMVVGSGIDRNAYAFNFTKNGKKPMIISCGIVTKDRVPILETMR